MKNLKRALSMVLTVAMLAGMMVVGTGAAFADVKAEHNEEAIAVVSVAGIMGANEEFNPDAYITRNEMAVVMVNMLGLDTDDFAGASKFTDVPAWAADYVDACYANGIVSGVSATEYNGTANVTTAEAALMMMKALGYFQYASDFGSDWLLATIKQSAKIDLLDDIDAKSTAKLTRNEVAQLCFNALETQIVSYVESNLAVNDAGTLHNVYTYYVNDSEDTLMVDLFGDDLYKGAEDETDDLGRPTVTWTYEKKGEDKKSETVTKAAELVYVNVAKAKDIKADLKAAELAKDEEADVADEIAALTANGTTVYVYEIEDEVVAVPVKKELVTVSALTNDKVSTKEDDERAVEFSNGLKVVADDEVTEGAEIDNFKAIFALEEDDAVIVVVANDGDDYIYSVEIPEIVEAKITRVKDGEIVAGGETYAWAVATDAKTTKDAVELTVLDGVVYAQNGIDAEESDVVYVDTVFDVEEDKWGKESQKAQIVTEDFEIIEVALDMEETAPEAGKFYTYETNKDGEYAFEAAELTAVEAVDKKDAIRASGYYFDADVQYVYIEKSGKDLAVTVKEGVQKNAAGVAVLNDDDDIVLVYVMGAYDDGASDDVIFLANTDVNAEVVDLEGEPANEYKVYVDGEAEFWMIDSTVAEGFYTYEQDEETGVYALVTEKGYNDQAIEIEKDKYVFCGEIEEATVKAIYDLTDEGLTTLAKIADWDGEALTFSFLYDEDDNVITALYVDFAE